MLQNYIKQILSLYNYIDAVVMINENGIIEYSDNFREDINNLYDEELVGRYLWDIYPQLNEENSTLLKVLKSGKSILNGTQHLVNYKGVEIDAINSTFPIKSEEKIIGAVEVSIYIEPGKQRTDITLKLKEREEKRQYYDIDQIITNDENMLNVKKTIVKLAKSDSLNFNSWINRYGKRDGCPIYT